MSYPLVKMWFEKLMGFKEESPAQVRRNISLEGVTLTSLVNGKSYECGTLTLPSLGELRQAAPLGGSPQGTPRLKVSEVVGDVQAFHKKTENAGAFFQAASQFNLLEMVGPHVSPERGIGIYEYDRTQGPACAIACGAGTIYRNYFAGVNGKIGQTVDNQIDTLSDIALFFNNADKGLWTMKNGYALATRQGLEHITETINHLDAAGRQALKDRLRIGVQWDTEVTIGGNPKQRVTQAYCSALPVAYSQVGEAYWEAFARLVLEASYEATLHAALANARKTGNDRVFLTLLGGGAFGNKTEWIISAISQTLHQFRYAPLDIRLVSYGRSSATVSAIIRGF